MIPQNVQKYLAARSAAGPWKIEGCGGSGFAGAVVIPALAEEESLFATLHSLERNPPGLLSRFLVLAVVNHRADADGADKAANLRTLRKLSGASFSSLQLAWIDASSKGMELPERTGGVGMARKIGFDLALARLDYSGAPPLLVALDADTLVRPDYLEALLRHFETTREGGAVIPFIHQEGETPEENLAIERYELFLRHYVLGLSLAGSPYSFHTVGSAMACRADAYVRAGGMNRRRAGEDFYFLQQLAKTSGMANLKGTVVHPSARSSHRVPFGTGRAIARMLAGEEDTVRFYSPECFRLLGAWLSLAAREWRAPGSAVLDKARDLSEPLAEYLNHLDLPAVWGRLQRNHPSREAFLTGFHGWFDGFKTLRFIHHLCAGPLPRSGPEEALPWLLDWAQLEAAGDAARHLARLREHQTGGDSPKSLLYGAV
jgi:hypothetical protein